MTAHRPGLAAVSLLKWFGLGGPAETTLHSLHTVVLGGQFGTGEVAVPQQPMCPAGVSLTQRVTLYNQVHS